MAEMTPEQQQALAIAAARLRLQTQPQQPQSQPADDAISVSRTGIGGLIEGIPIAGPIMRDWTERAAGATLAAFSDETYDQVMDRIHDANRAEKEANPIVDKGAQITGAVAGTIPAVMAAPAAFGAGGGSLLLRSGISGLTGATIGGADAGVRTGGDLDAMWHGAKLGGLFGLGGPVAGKVVGAGARSLVDALRTRAAARIAGMDPQAFGYFRRAVTDDGLDAVSLPQKLQEMGSNAIPADLGPNLQKQAGALAATPGAAQTTIRTTLADRAAGANARIGQTIDETTGRNVVPSEVQADIAANQNAHSPLYREAFREARPYNTEPIASALEADIGRLRGPAQARLRQVRGMLNIADSNVLSTDPGVMFQTRQAIDGLLKTEVDPKVISALVEARQMLDDGLTRAVPRIKEIDAGYSELARQDEAMTRGQQVLDSGRTAPRPSELAGEVERGAQPQGMQIGPSAVPLRLSQGARAEIDRIVGTNSNDIVAMNRLIKGEGDWNRARLATLFGPEKAERLFKVLDNESVWADTANTVTRNSETAARLAAQNELGGGVGNFGVKEAFKAGGFLGAARSAAIDKVDDIVKALMSSETGNATRESLARALIGEQREKLVDGLMRAKGMGTTPALVDPVVKALLLNAGTARTR
ncbi:hypothetical protein GR239_27715 [Rhizobium leguminosarum]|uniref:hypothetical protein n=1 Tax=Rhizobium ruizarguesonis TaxID=2081791 RepID=UPI0013B7D906|nr:hypothetical protein [Rhizobium ruizarguesonis]NEH87768.1 hypothetical protein [Rhizobium ruizarguesonis]NEJ60298.1 hypothetical protein [Rhizobium ruizarguesonis]NEJ67374.1 hypothetical protein [Rhizobium ruizarguesonis]NEK04322.1 hypothetical protein [Rhizobium ruizarguesonis]